MYGNVSAMVSTGIKITELPIKHLAKTFYFVFILFILKAKSKDLADILNIPKISFKHQNPY